MAFSRENIFEVIEPVNEEEEVEDKTENKDDEKNIYALYSDKTGVTFFVKKGAEVDGGNSKLDEKGDKDVQLTVIYDKNSRCKDES